MNKDKERENYVTKRICMWIGINLARERTTREEYACVHDEATAAVTATDDVEIEEVLKCELWTSDCANSLKSCFEHARPG